MPSLRLKCWNATRWLERSIYLMALCKTYEYILEHLSDFASETTELSSHRKTAADLYERLTSYETFLFIFLYNELAWIMAKYFQRLQIKDIGIRDVGRNIMSLCGRLRMNYNLESALPIEMLSTGMSDEIMEELGNDQNRKLRRLELTDVSDILELEKTLQSIDVAVGSDTQITEHRTHGMDVSSSYLDILSRRMREEREREINLESENIQ